GGGLVITQDELVVERDGQLGAVLVGRQILDRPAQRDERLLEGSARRCDEQRLAVAGRTAQQLGHGRGAPHLGQQRRLVADQSQQPGLTAYRLAATASSSAQVSDSTS